MTHEVIAAARIGVGSVAAKKITGRYPSTEILGDARLPMLELYSGKTRLPMDIAVGGPDPLRDWEVFLWTPR